MIVRDPYGHELSNVKHSIIRTITPLMLQFRTKPSSLIWLYSGHEEGWQLHHPGDFCPGQIHAQNRMLNLVSSHLGVRVDTDREILGFLADRPSVASFVSSKTLHDY